MIAKNILIVILFLSSGNVVAGEEHIELGCNVMQFKDFKGKSPREIYDWTKLRYSPRSDYARNMHVEKGYLKVAHCAEENIPNYMWTGFVKDIEVLAGCSYIMQLVGRASRSGVSRLFIGNGSHEFDYIESYKLHDSFMRFYETPALETAEKALTYSFTTPGRKGSIVKLHVGALFENYAAGDTMFIKSLKVLLLDPPPSFEKLSEIILNYRGHLVPNIVLHRTLYNFPLSIIEKIADIDYKPTISTADDSYNDWCWVSDAEQFE